MEKFATLSLIYVRFWALRLKKMLVPMRNWIKWSETNKGRLQDVTLGKFHLEIHIIDFQLSLSFVGWKKWGNNTQEDKETRNWCTLIIIQKVDVEVSKEENSLIFMDSLSKR